MKKVKFYHVPKSGGTAIFNMTKTWDNFKRAHPNKNHVQVYKYPPGLGEIGLIVIRHPYSRFLSAFYHMVDACDPNFYYRNAPQSDCETLKSMGIDFNKYNRDPNYFLSLLNTDPDVRKILDTFSVFRSQFYWVKDIFGIGIHPGIEIILRQETLDQDLKPIATMLGQTIHWPTDARERHERISQDTIPLNEMSKKILRMLYSDDFKHFNW